MALADRLASPALQQSERLTYPLELGKPQKPSRQKQQGCRSLVMTHFCIASSTLRVRGNGHVQVCQLRAALFNLRIESPGITVVYEICQGFETLRGPFTVLSPHQAACQDPQPLLLLEQPSPGPA